MRRRGRRPASTNCCGTDRQQGPGCRCSGGGGPPPPPGGYFDQNEGQFGVGTSWSQASSATVELKALISLAMAAAGVFQPRVFQPRVFQPRVFQPRVFQPRVFQPRVFHPRVFLGRRFINLATSLSEVGEAWLRSRPLGMNWRRNRLVLLFDPRGLGACGSQNQRSIFRRRASSGWQVISDPHS